MHTELLLKIRNNGLEADLKHRIRAIKVGINHSIFSVPKYKRGTTEIQHLAALGTGIANGHGVLLIHITSVGDPIEPDYFGAKDKSSR